jgi:hypothetical protein
VSALLLARPAVVCVLFIAGILAAAYVLVIAGILSVACVLVIAGILAVSCILIAAGILAVARVLVITGILAGRLYQCFCCLPWYMLHCSFWSSVAGQLTTTFL